VKIYSIVIRVLATILVFFQCSILHAACFSPLANPKSSDPNDWQDLLNFSPTTTNPEVMEIQRLSSGSSDNVNLDYYSYTFRRHPSKTIQEVFLSMRKKFPIYAKGGRVDSGQYFLPYRKSAGPDEIQKTNEKVWLSSNPNGALMSFVLATLQPVLTLHATLGTLKPVLEQGDVLVTCASDLDFIFTTVRTIKDDWHPVSGNRGFGLRDNGNGTWTFFTKATDRAAPYIGVTLDKAVVRAFNLANPFSKNAPDADDHIFQLGHEFWLRFFETMIDDLGKQNMELIESTVNSRRYPYK